MPKSKEILDSDDDLSSGEEVKKRPAKKTKVEKAKPAKKRPASEDEDEGGKENDEVENNEEEAASGSESDDATAKKKKPAAAKAKSKASAANDDEPGVEKGMYTLSKGSKRFISVSEFRNKPYINIREYYEANGKLNPGKKGISLSVEQWEGLKAQIAKIDADLKKFK